jgi:hypothetical protein
MWSGDFMWSEVIGERDVVAASLITPERVPRPSEVARNPQDRPRGAILVLKQFSAHPINLRFRVRRGCSFDGFAIRLLTGIDCVRQIVHLVSQLLLAAFDRLGRPVYQILTLLFKIVSALARLRL